MAAYASILALKTAITDTIYQNNAGLVTAQVLQERLIDIIDTLESLFTTDIELAATIADTIETLESEMAAADSALVDGAPAALDTLNELAAAINDDANFNTTVNTALATKSDKNASIVSKTGTYQVQSTDNNKIIECSGTFTVTLPNSLDSGFQCIIVNVGTGIITIVASTTLQSKEGNNKLAAQYGAAAAYHRGSNVWLVTGDLSS